MHDKRQEENIAQQRKELFSHHPSLTEEEGEEEGEKEGEEEEEEGKKKREGGRTRQNGIPHCFSHPSTRALELLFGPQVKSTTESRYPKAELNC